MPKLDAQQIDDLSHGLPLWRVESDSLFREFVFADFGRAFNFMTEVAGEAERADHHPDWSNVYNRVSVLLTTHDAGGVTEKDAAMARFIDAAAVRFGVS